MSYLTGYNSLPPHVRFRWSGWEADVDRLLRCGWEIEAGIDHYRMETLYFLRNKELNLKGATKGVSRISWEQYMDCDGRGVRIEVQMASDIIYHIHESFDYANIEHKPVELGYRVDGEIVNLDYFMPENKASEIVVEKRPDVIDLLNQIKDLQSPKAKEILANERKKSKVESFEMSANIITLRA